MEAKEFTFVMLTYNQEQYVIEHMESIKYQVLHYGKEYKTYFLLSDDASKDNTVAIVEKWLEQEKLFDDVKIMVAPQNGGIVKNYVNALKNVKTKRFKILAGDDLYNSYNIYELVELADFVATPALKIRDKNIFPHIFWRFFEISKRKGDKRKLFLQAMKDGWPFETPGVFWNHAYAGEELYQELAKSKWIEDVPCYHYLLRQEGLSVVSSEKPYVLYRIDSGISNKKHHESRNQEYYDEIEFLKRKYFINQCKFPKRINNLRYLYRAAAKRISYRYFFSKFNKWIHRIETQLQEETAIAATYYLEISAKAGEWMRENRDKGFAAKNNS